MDLKTELMMAGHAILATLLGALIGWERQRHGREAGIRTYAAVSLGACVFGLIGSHVPGAAPTRIASYVVSGVGFLGAGVILRDKGQITGLTTAATIWATASVGLAISFEMYTLGILSALIVFGLLASHHLPHWHRIRGTESHDDDVQDDP